uniref:Uncharacterized protein n=1 Tax=Rhizophora mucronata TaxID=61149 RepID=A0A2P2Q9Y9_RHIMU
MLEKSNMFKC